MPAGQAGLARADSAEEQGDLLHYPAETGSESWLTSHTKNEQLSEFISGLGPGQLVGRQVGKWSEFAFSEICLPCRYSAPRCWATSS